MNINIAHRVRAHATILAALRYWAREGLDNASAEIDIASDGGAIEPLSAQETDELAERINCGGNGPLVVVEINGGAVHSASADSPVHLVILDQDTDGAEGDRVATVDGCKVFVTEQALSFPTQQEAERLERIITELNAWTDSQVSAPRSDIQCRQIGRDDFGIDGHDTYMVVWSTVDEVSEGEAKEWLYQRFYTGEPSANRLALTHVSVMPHASGCKWVGVLNYVRDV